MTPAGNVTSDVAEVVVVGAGIVGASIAYHLARGGAEVVLLDRSVPGAGATGDSFAWIGRGTAGAPPEQLLLRRDALKDYRRLERELPGVQVRWTGSLSWAQGEQADVDTSVGAQTGDGRWVDAHQAARLEPRLQTVPARAELRPGDGAVDPIAVTEALVAGAREHGARLRTGVTVHDLTVNDEYVTGVSTSVGFLPASTVVMANGVDAPRLCRPLGFALPVTSSPALLMRFTAAPGLVQTLVANDRIEIREATDGDLLVAWDYSGETTREELDRAGQRMLTQLRSSFAGAEDVELVSVRVGDRPMPADGSPVIGPVPGTAGGYLAVMHSAVTLAPTVGRLVADEILHGTQAEKLRQLRPSRFT